MASEAKIDENLYSRQLGVFGIETMGKLTQMRVLVVGMRGVGVETAKNLTLAGPKQVTIHDDSVVEPADLGRNYYLAEEDVGKRSRAAASRRHLAKLNPYVSVDIHEGPITEEVVAQHHVAIFTATPRDQLIRFNEFCRAQSPPITFIAGDVLGAFGFAFSDFGPSFAIRDPAGLRPEQGILADVTKGSPATVMLHSKPHTSLVAGDWVKFEGVEGMEELNTQGPFKVVGTGAHGFKIEDTSGFGDYTGGGRFEQASLRQRIVCPHGDAGMLRMDGGHFERAPLLHAVAQGLYSFEAAQGASPRPHEEAEAGEVVKQTRAFLAGNAEAARSGDVPTGEHPLEMEVGDAEEKVVRALARVAGAELAPLAAFFGGVLAQEAVKHTGKYTPIRQWFYLDALDALPSEVTRLPDPGAEEVPALDPADVVPRGDRYDDLTVLLGASWHKRVRANKVFMVGAGALGCELLKNFAMLGAGSGDAGGKVTVTDMDHIEMSNLNRQFLFRQENVGRPKSVVAAAAATQMNPGLTVEAMQTGVGEDTEEVFTEEFWRAQDVVVGALDNVKARMYVDSCCVLHERPLLDSGTLGTKCHVQVVLPHRTATYADIVDPPEESIPLCTIKNFPHQVEHCIEWSREVFTSLFEAPARDAQLFAKDGDAFLRDLASDGNPHTQRQRLERLKETAALAKSGSLRECAHAARRAFETLFANQAKQLLTTFPLDYTDHKGNKFWSGTKTPPQPAVFDLGNEDHALFLHTCTNLFAAMVGVDGLPTAEPDKAALQSLLDGVHVPEFVPREDVRIKESDDDRTEEGSDEDEEVVRKLGQELLAMAKDGGFAGVEAMEFEKDDDSNGHIDFVTASANARARSYRIQTAPRHEVKRIAGKIIPAIATTTCAVTGLVTLELLKTVQRKPLESHRDANSALCVNMHHLFEPKEPKRTVSVEMDPVYGCPVRAVPEGFTVWDKVEVHMPDATLAELCAEIEKRTPGAKVGMVTYGKYSLYAPIMFRSHAARRDRKVRELLEEVTHEPLSESARFVTIDVGLEDDEGDVVIPRVLFYVK